MVCAGIPRAIIQEMLLNPYSKKPISNETFQKYFHGDFIYGKHRANHAVAKGLYHNAVRCLNVDAQKFWLRTQAAWKEPPTQVVVAPGKFTLELGDTEDDDTD